ncbi:MULTISPECIES: RNaseH domain-containing protein [unclassified Streptomyces]|uniref:RNaseH domain-containing protein n=1 Tax=Streptomyces sp. TP-A0356 TaxID=1359208 RepID=UPI0006E3AC20|nr:RNaseH domain-containing protein [Streptomyces sp. TP-A0356]
MPHYPRQQSAVFAFAPDAELTVHTRSAAIPAPWLRHLRTVWETRPGRHSVGSLPTRSLSALLPAFDPRITTLSHHLESPHALRATAEPAAPFDLAVAAWAATDVAPHLPNTDWEALLGEHPVQWRNDDLDLAHLARAHVHPNNTANPAEPVWSLLPSLLAEHITTTGLTLAGHDYTGWLGPTQPDNRRRVYLGPPIALTDRTGAHGLYTHYIEFHLETIPGDPQVRVHADLHMARFAARPMSYVPRRGDKAATLSALLHTDTGFLTSHERRVLVQAELTLQHTGDGPRLAWSPRISRLLALLSRPRYPAPDTLRTDPASLATSTEQSVAAWATHSTGMRYYLPEHPEATPAARKSAEHPAAPGYQPRDHLEVFDALTPLFAPLGLIPIAATRKAPARTRALPPPSARIPAGPRPHYHLEHWTTSPRTRQALHLALTDKLQLAPESSESADSPATYTGEDYSLTVHPYDPGTLTGGRPRSTHPDRAVRRAEDDRARAAHTQQIHDHVPHTAALRAAVIELEDQHYFGRNQLLDPKTSFKATLPALGRRVQCMRPVLPAPDKASKVKRYPGTDLRSSDIERSAASALDALRQIGYLPDLPQPAGITGPFELITLWMPPAPGNQCVPMILRARPGTAPTAQLMPTRGSRYEPEIPFTQLPQALTEKRGRINAYRERPALVDFLRQALAPDSTTDRIFLARAATLRHRDIWPWLQDTHLTPGAIHAPGTRLDQPESIPTPRKPGDLPGLRIIRLREAADRAAVAHLFGVPYDEQAQQRTPGNGRFSGLVQHSDTVFYGLNPRPAQNQTPLDVTKLDPARPQDATWSVHNPRPLEIVTAFLQDGDDPAELAMYVQALRRSVLHTTNGTVWPWLIHCADLMTEYLV